MPPPGPSALSADLNKLNISRRNTNALELTEDEKVDPATPRGMSKTGNPLMDYATNRNSDFVPRSVEEAKYFGGPMSFGTMQTQMSHLVSPSPGSLKANFLTNDVINSLPKPLAPAQRERVIREKQQTPTFELVRKVNKYKNLMGACTKEGQKLRRQLLSGAVVVIVCAGYSGKRFIYEKAKELGVRIIMVDGPDSWSQTLLEDGIIEKYLPLDMSNPTEVFEEALKLVQNVDREVGGIDGICTFWEIAVPLVARLTETLGLPGNNATSIDTARDKHQTRVKLREANLPTPSSIMIYSEDDLQAAADHVGFPAVLKPINGAASLGVVRVNSHDELVSNYWKVFHLLKKGADPLDVHGQKGDDKKDSMFKLMMMEQYLDGDEVDIDVILVDGKATYAKVTDNLPTYEPWFNETGAVTPSLLADYKQKEMEAMSVKMCNALGLTTGVMHVEMKYTTTNGPQLIEVNCRMGGGPVRYMNLAVWGVDLIEEHLMTSVGLPAAPPVPEKPITCIGEFSVNAKKTGTMGEEFPAILQKVKELPDVVEVEALVQPGDKVVGLEDGMPTWIADIMCSKPTAKEALDYITKLEADLVQPIK